MKRLPLLAVLLAVGMVALVLVGCGLTGPAARMLSRTESTAVPQVIEKLVVATPQVQAGADTGANQAAAQPPAAQQVVINIPAGADMESEILKAVYQKVNPSVVYIENLAALQGADNQQAIVPESQGSGFIWDTQGHIVTNQHVVAGSAEILVTFSDGTALPAEVVGTDPDSDLAVVRVDPKLVKLAPVDQGKIEEVQVGQRALAIGNPFGFVGTLTEGIVSAVGRSIPSGTGFSIPLAIQTDAAINPGNSGGPLLNERGQVIGVNAQIRSASNSNSGVGFAIPINIVQRVVPALIQSGTYTHAYLGVRGQTYSPAWADVLGFPTSVRGAYIIAVTKGGPSDKAGLRSADTATKIILGMTTDGPEYLASGGDLVTAIDGKPVTTFDDLLIYLESSKSPGEKVTLTVLRPDGQQRTVTITLGERPRSQQ